MEHYRGYDIKPYTENFRFNHLLKVESNGKQAFPYLFPTVEKARRSVDIWHHADKDLDVFRVCLANPNFKSKNNIEQTSAISTIIKRLIGIFKHETT